MHFGSESSRGPSLKKAGSHPIADLEFGDGWTGRDDFPSAVGQWYPPWDRMAIVLPADDDQVAIVERSRFDPNDDLAIARIRQSPIDKLQAFRTTILLDFVGEHRGSCRLSVVSCQRLSEDSVEQRE